MVVFFNAGQLPAQEDLYYIDDVFWTRSSYTGCIDDHESDVSSITNFSYFANGHLESEGITFEVVDNPNATGINESPKVGKFVKASDGDPWAGMFANLDAPIDFGTNKTAKAKVLMDHIGNFAIKLEGSLTGADNIELPVENTVMGEWEELTFDFSDVSDDAQYTRLTLFFDLLIDATGEDVTSYFDDIVIGDGNCAGPNSVFEPVIVEPFHVSPNPVSNVLKVDNALGVKTITVFNLWGQKVASMVTDGMTNIQFPVAELGKGMYLLAGYNENGQLVSNAKFVKE